MLRLQSLAFFSLNLPELFDSANVPPIGKLRTEENLDDLPALIFAEQIDAQAQHIAMIVFASDPRGHLIVRQGGTNAKDLIGRDRHADAAAIQQDGRLGGAIDHRAGSGNGIVRIIHRSAAFTTKVHDLMPQLLEQRQKPTLSLISSMIACHR